MIDEDDRSIAFSVGSAIDDAYPEQKRAKNFVAFVKLLHGNRSASKAAAGYIAGPFNGDGHRCAEGLLPRRFLAADLDRIDADVLPDVRLWFARFSGCAWPTHSSTDEAPRERAIIELDREINRAEGIAIGRALTADLHDEFGAGVYADKSTFKGEQPLFFVPEAVSIARFDGDALDVDRYLAAAAQLPPEREAPPVEAPDGKVRVNRNAFLSGEGYRLRKHGQPIEQIETVLQAMNLAACEPPLAASEVQAIARGKRIVNPDPPAAEYQPETTPGTPPVLFTLRSAAELTSAAPMDWRVKNLLPARGIAALFGPPMSGKSFLALDLAMAIAEGRRTWFGRRVKATRIVYLALEGAAGFGQRLSAWERHHQRPIPDAVEFITEPVKLTEDVVKLIASLAHLGDDIMVVIDTLNAATPGADENASRDTGLILEATKMLAAATNGLVLLVAHTGKDEARGLRGHSSQFAALDGAIQTTNEGGRRSWESAKVKDAEAGTVHAFRLRLIQLGNDADGDPISSCVIELDDAQVESAPRAQPRGSNQRIVLKTLAPMFKDSQALGRGGAPGLRPCVALEEAVTACTFRMTCEAKHKAQYSRVAVNALVAGGILGCGDGWLWLI
jgi:hypothetical protein